MSFDHEKLEHELFEWFGEIRTEAAELHRAGVPPFMAVEDAVRAVRSRRRKLRERSRYGPHSDPEPR